MTALLSTSRGNLSLFKHSVDSEYHQSSIETRCNIWNPPDSVTNESRADQSSESIWNDDSSKNTMTNSSISMMLFPARNLSSCSIPHKRSRSSRSILRLNSSDLSVLYALMARLEPSPANSNRWGTKIFPVKILKNKWKRQFTHAINGYV